ncbi:Ig-like domain-containing protein [Colwellia sp. RE-S-Sl-9]
MKIIKKSLLIGAISTALFGCGDESYKPDVKTSNVAPVVSSNIQFTAHETDDGERIYLLGTASGKEANTNNGAAGVTDADGDVLFVTNFTADTDDLTGFEFLGNAIFVRPSALASTLDTGETKTVVFSYDVSDGTETSTRTATLSVTGEDVAPIIIGDLVGNYTKDAGTGTLNLLINASDADGEPLTASNLVASADNRFVLPSSLNENNELVLDIASIASQVADGEKVTLNYTYQISDHNHDLTRNLMINILGVKDVPGAPLISSYFLNDELNETDTSKVYDLVADVVDREGDAIIVKNVKLNGAEALMYGAKLEGNNLTFTPNAFLTDIAAGANMSFEFTYQIEDANGNTSDGERSLAIVVNGVESNILVNNGASVDFEGLPAGNLPSNIGWRKITYDGVVANPVVSTNSAHSGSNSIFLEKGLGLEINWPATADRIYYYGGWTQTTEDINANFLHFNVYGGTRAWWQAGVRQWVNDSTQWLETTKVFTTFDWDLGTIVPDALFQSLNGPTCCSDSDAYVDDLRIVDITDIDGYANNMLTMNASSFEDGVVPTNNGVGVIGVTDTATEVTSGTYALTVDTTDNASASEVVLPVQAGAVKAGGRYMLQLDIHPTNAPVDVATGFEVKLETASGEVYNFSASTWSNTVNSAVRVMLNTDSATGTPDWENEDVSVRLRFQIAGIVYHIDNLALFAIP